MFEYKHTYIHVGVKNLTANTSEYEQICMNIRKEGKGRERKGNRSDLIRISNRKEKAMKKMRGSEDLHIALDEVKRGDGHVSETAAEDASEGTGSVEGRRVHVDLLGGLAGRGNHDALLGLPGGGCEVVCGGHGVEHPLQGQSLGGGGGGVEVARDQGLAGLFV